jgi:hypothetical protein
MSQNWLEASLTFIYIEIYSTKGIRPSTFSCSSFHVYGSVQRRWDLVSRAVQSKAFIQMPCTTGDIKNVVQKMHSGLLDLYAFHCYTQVSIPLLL